MDTPPESNKPPITQIVMERFLGETFTQENLYTISNLAFTRIRNDPNRVSWLAINEGANDVRVSFLPNVSATSGWLLAANGGVIGMDWATDGEGASYDIYLIAVGAPDVIRLREVIRS